MSSLPRREFLAGVTSVVLAAGCRSQGGSGAEDAIGPLIAPSALAARLDDVKTGKIAVLYVGPEVPFHRGHVPGARQIGEAGSDEGRRALSEASVASSGWRLG